MIESIILEFLFPVHLLIQHFIVLVYLQTCDMQNIDHNANLPNVLIKDIPGTAALYCPYDAQLHGAGPLWIQFLILYS